MCKRTASFAARTFALAVAVAAIAAPSAGAVDLIEQRADAGGGLATAVAIEDPNIRPGLAVALARVAEIAIEDPNIMPGFGVFTAAAAQTGR